MACRMSWGGDGMHSRRDKILSRFQLPSIGMSQLIGEYAAIQTRARGRKLIGMDVHFAACEVAQSARMIVMQVADKNEVDIRRPQPKPAEVMWNTLLLAHLWRFHQWAHRVEILCTQ